MLNLLMSDVAGSHHEVMRILQNESHNPDAWAVLARNVRNTEGYIKSLRGHVLATAVEETSQRIWRAELVALEMEDLNWELAAAGVAARTAVDRWAAQAARRQRLGIPQMSAALKLDIVSGGLDCYNPECPIHSPTAREVQRQHHVEIN